MEEATAVEAEAETVDKLCYGMSELLREARQGSWRTLLGSADRQRKLLPLNPHEQLAYAALSVLALAKLRRYSDAAQELASLGDLDDPRYRYEHPSHGGFYGSRCGSMVPFFLRWLHAQLPSYLGHSRDSLRRLYRLLHFVSARSNPSEPPPQTLASATPAPKHENAGPEGETVDSQGSVRGNYQDDDKTVDLDRSSHDDSAYFASRAALWRRREEIVINSIVCHHLSQKEYVTAMKWMGRLLQRSPEDPFLVSMLGHVQLQLGDLKGAGETFGRVETLAAGNDAVEIKNLVRRNRALEHIIHKDYVAAVHEYEEALEKDPADVIATNNKALCLMYSRDLLGSIKVLENALEMVPSAALNENLVLNLCSMYELAFASNTDAKKSLSTWILQVAPDDFDVSCTRL